MTQAKTGTGSVTVTETLPTVVEALVAVMGDVQAIGKDDTNQQQNYKYRGVDAVVNAVGPALRAHSVICVPISVTHDTEHYKTSRGTEMRDVTVIVGFRFYGPAGDYIDAMAAGEAADAGDKATPKAHSVAYRTMLLQALCIPTGDPDPDSQSHERGSRATRRVDHTATPVPKGWAEIEQYVRSENSPDDAWALFSAFTRAASNNLFGKTDSSELDQAQKDTLYQKAAGAAVWLVDNAPTDGPFRYFDESTQRTAWQHVLNTKDPLPIPDYTPPEPSPAEAEAEGYDDEAARIAAEAFADPS